MLFKMLFGFDIFSDSFLNQEEVGMVTLLIFDTLGCWISGLLLC